MGQNASNYLTTTLARAEPETLDQNMTRGDLIYALENLRFMGRDQRHIIEIDKAVRDYLVSALRRRS
jgi:hypothetical protein